MTPEAQRIAIAEACGWKSPKHPEVREWCSEEMNQAGCWWQNPAGKFTAPFPPATFPEALPDYLADLNAMHEAERVLNEEQQQGAYPMHLLRCAWMPERKGIDEPEGGWWRITTYETAMLISATAAQRAEAFLRTIGKWDDSK